MYVIVVYDAAPKRGVKLLKYLRTKLNWVQNSVFEGELTESSFIRFKADIKNIIEKEEDSLIYYTLQNADGLKREVFGVEKNDLSNFI